MKFRYACRMREPSLRETLGLIVTLAAACGGKIETTGTGAGSAPADPSAASQPNDAPEECPHVVELRSFDRTVSPEQACSLAAGAPGCFSYSCQPAAAECAIACADPTVNACRLPVDYLSEYKLAAAKVGDAGYACPARDASVGLTLHCAVSAIRGSKRSGCPVEGRRPAGLVGLDARAANTVAGYLEESAWLEAASVRAFDDLADDLERLEAPLALHTACRVAATEERRHTALVGALVEHFGGTSRRLDVASHEDRTTFELAMENAVEGTVRETFGAAVALFRARHASDAKARAAMLEIAEDECRHAKLAGDVADVLDGELTPSERAAIARARMDAIAELESSFEDDPPADVREVLGVPSAAQSRKILEELVSRVWQPGLAH